MMKKILILLAAMVMLVCAFATIASATDSAEEIDYNLPYYDKVYTDSNGVDLALYEKVGDTYYPLVWFKYVDANEKTKYVKAHFADCTTDTFDANNGRLNGVSYVYTDENGTEITLKSKDVVLLNLRDGKLSSNGKAIRKIEQRGDNSAYNQVEAIYLPLTLDGTFGWAIAYSSLRVLDFDRNHTTPVSLQQHIVDGSKIKEIFIPGCAKFEGNGQFQNCTTLEKIVFGNGFNANNLSGKILMGYTFANCKSLKTVCFMGDYVEANSSNNGPYPSLTKISAQEYLALEDKSGNYAITNCTECIAFGHKTGSTVTSEGDYFGTVLVNGECPVCSEKYAVASFEGMFEWIGYSRSQFADVNGAYSVIQGYKVNREIVDGYKAIVGDVNFGVLAAVGNSAPALGDSKVISCDFTDDSVDCFEIKVNGILENMKNTKIVFCAYLKVADKLCYLDVGETKEEVSGLSYNDIPADE